MKQLAASLCSSMLPAAQTQGRVIHALILREIKTRFGRFRLGYVWALLEPLMYIIVLISIFRLWGRSSISDMPLALFMITGLLPYLAFTHTLQVTMTAVEPNRSLLTFPQVTPVDLVFARALLEVATLMVVFVLLLVGAVAVLGPFEIENPLGVVAWLITAGLLGLGYGALFGALSPMFPALERLVPALFVRPLFFISGIFFTAEILPTGLRDLAMINPLLNISELLRSAFFPNFESPHDDMGYTLIFALATVFLGLVTHRAMRKKILLP